jgi:excinuclease UvrABC nuclease subunit
MVAKTYGLTFGGYWLADAVSSLPASSGIYCVYACSHNPSLRQVSLRRLLYIGEAANVRDRVSIHERWNDWRNRLMTGEKLCFSAATISPQEEVRPCDFKEQ